eukprot:23229-Hanusia_phi.AAC.1
MQSGRSAIIDSFAWHSSSFYLPAWRGLCFGRSDGIWSPDFQRGVVGGRLIRRRWDHLLGGRGASSWVGQHNRTAEEGSDLGRAEGGGLRCNVLEWRLRQRSARQDL